MVGVGTSGKVSLIGGTFKSAGMRQADPQEDYALAQSRDEKLATNGQQRKADDKKQLVQVHAPSLFVHHNQIKIDSRHPDSLVTNLLAPNGTMLRQRLWGQDDSLSKLAGYDVEKAMWESVLMTTCTTAPVEGCDELNEWFQEVFTR